MRLSGVSPNATTGTSLLGMLAREGLLQVFLRNIIINRMLLAFVKFWGKCRMSTSFATKVEKAERARGVAMFSASLSVGAWTKQWREKALPGRVGLDAFSSSGYQYSRYRSQTSRRQ